MKETVFSGEPSRGVAVAVQGVKKTFPNGGERLEVLRDVSFSVSPGEVVAVTGESGSGKSTLLSLMAGLDLPDQGTIRVGPREVQALDEEGLTRYRARTVGLVFQFHYLLKDFSVLENVMLPALMQQRSREEASVRATELLAQVGLQERLHHLPPQLSGGERQRAAAARALINDPEVVLADEPTGNLDDANSRRLEEVLFGLVSEYGKTLIIVTHDQNLARRTARSFHLEQGCLVSD